MQKIADVVGPKVFISYISKLTAEQKKIYDDLSESRARVDDRLGFILFLREKLCRLSSVRTKRHLMRLFLITCMLCETL